jgi:hypothetical protein
VGLKIYGIAAAQNPDKDGQTIIIKNMDTSRLRYINDEHGDKMFDFIGGISDYKKIYSEQDCESEKQKRCWNLTKVPFLYVEGELADGEGHPNAQSAAAMIKFSARRPEYPLKLGFSIEGGILAKEGDKDQFLSHTIGTGATVTVKPCNPKCLLFAETDLMKSSVAIEPPMKYIEMLQRSPKRGSIVETKAGQLMVKLEKLKKSIEDYDHAHTSMKCYGCGKAVRFFKSSKNLPNRCEKCDGSFRLSDIWKALNK